MIAAENGGLASSYHLSSNLLHLVNPFKPLKKNYTDDLVLLCCTWLILCAFRFGTTLLHMANSVCFQIWYYFVAHGLFCVLSDLVLLCCTWLILCAFRFGTTLLHMAYSVCFQIWYYFVAHGLFCVLSDLVLLCCTWLILCAF